MGGPLVIIVGVDVPCYGPPGTASRSAGTTSHCHTSTTWAPLTTHRPSSPLHARRYGAQFKLWRRSYDTKPPRVDSFSSHYPGNDRRYVQEIKDVRVSLSETLVRSFALRRLSVHRKLPRTESLKVP